MSAEHTLPDEAKRRRLKTHVSEWISQAEIIDGNMDRFNDREREAYLYIKNVFDNPSVDEELLQNHQETMRQLGMECQDSFGAAVKTFASKVRFITSDYELFRDILRSGEAVPTLGSAMPEEPATQRQTPAAKPVGRHFRRLELGGMIWEGEFEGDTPVGQGKITFGNGSIYEGEWNSCGPNGHGILRWNYGEEWDALFKDGNPVKGYIHGKGYEYIGQLNGSGPHGYGKRTFQDRTEVGLFVNGVPAGVGRITWNNGDSYEGQWGARGGEGKGKAFCREYSRTDKGTFRDGVRVGQGRMEWQTGSWYEGGWNNNGKHGRGTFFNAQNNRTDRGEYYDDKRFGKGRMEWTNGDWAEGEWNENGFNGYAVRFYAASQETQSGTFKDGKWSGKGKIHWGKTNQTYEGTWSEDANGKMCGKGKYTNSDGSVEYGEYVAGKWVTAAPQKTVTIGAGTSTAKKTTTTSTTTKKESSDSDFPSAELNARNIIAIIIAVPIIIYTFIALLGSGSWYQALICGALIFIPYFIFKNEEDGNAGAWSPLSLYGYSVGICSLVYFWGSTFGDKPWYWFFGACFWCLAAFCAIGLQLPGDN